MTVLIAVGLVAGIGAEAAAITWGAPRTISGTADVSTNGASAFAYDWNSSVQTVNGVNFTAPGTGVTLSGFDGGTYAGFVGGTGAPATNLAAAYAGILQGAPYSAGATACTVALNNLTVGLQYQVQLWVNDSRGYGSSRNETVTSGGNTVTLAYNAGSVGSLGEYAIGTFTADSPTQVITLIGNASTQINALQLRTTSPITSPLITAQPQSQLASPGDAAAFSVSALGGSVLWYRWFHNGAGLPVSTNSALLLGNVTTNDAGSYFVLVSNSLGSATSSVAVLTVPGITLLSSNTPNPAQQAQIDRKYGMFCHFGINTFLNLEWSDGTYSPTNYAPTAIETDQWARTAWLAGMRYLICITKHHDGFCMWPSAYTTYSVAYSGNTNDVVRLVANSCAKYGIKLALYYSLWDRHEPAYTTNFNPDYITYMTNQLTELLGNYGPVCELWLDGSWDKPNTAWQVPVLYDLVKRLQPNCQLAVNWSIGAPGNVDSTVHPVNQQNGYPIRYFPSDFRLGDPDQPVFPDPKLFTNPNGSTNGSFYLPFEATITLSANNNWFFHAGDTNTKALGGLESMWNQCTAQSNMLVLNAPPDSNGQLLPSNTNALVQLASRLGLTPGQSFPANLAQGCAASASSVWQNDTNNYGPAQAVDEDANSRWASGPTGTTNGWLAIDFGKPTLFDQVIINEYSSRVQSFRLESWDGAAWQTITNGGTIGESLRLDFPAVTATKVRLNILSATDATSIYMFKVHYVNNAYLQWRGAHFGPNWPLNPQAADGADPDGDGLPNAMEYLLAGMDPMVPNPMPVPTLLTRGGDDYVQLQLLKNPQAASGSVSLRLSYDLANWFTPVTSSDGNVIVIDDDAQFTVQFRRSALPCCFFQIVAQL
jgi:alpha-L-fucosidase